VSVNSAFRWLSELLHVWEARGVETWVRISRRRERLE